jgi:uncharacterized protein (TIGR02996 family)
VSGADELLPAVLNDPDADGPRLAYADAIEENDPERAALIRVQCALGHITNADPRHHELAQRERKLLDRHAPSWLGPLSEVLLASKLYRGFLEEVLLTARDFLAHGEALYRLGPVRAVHLSQAHDLIGTLAQSPLLENVAFLDIGFNSIGTAELRTLLASPHCQRLTRLGLDDNRIDFESIRVLGQSALAERLKVLHIARNPVGDSGVTELTRAQALRQLAWLDLSGDALSSSSGQALAESNLTQLTALDLHGNIIGDAGIGFLAQGRLLAGVQQLNLSNTFIGDAGVAALAGSPYLYGLNALDLSGNRLTDASVPLLASSPNFTRLQILKLGGNPISAAAANTLRFRWQDSFQKG